ncbi:MAG TPA: hypothetical protein VH643_40775 [Gemmataceae bacterium]|jgi:phage FluMu protein Com
MPLTIACPNCGKSLKLPEAVVGKRVRCPGCQEIFTAEAPEEEEPIRPAAESEGVQERPSRSRRVEREEPEEEEEERPRRRPRRRRDDDDDDYRVRRGRPHRGGVVLTMGILAVVFGICCPLVCWIVGAIGLVMASTDLSQMSARQMDRSGQGITRAGQILSAVGIVIGILNAILGVILRVGNKL